MNRRIVEDSGRYMFVNSVLYEDYIYAHLQLHNGQISIRKIQSETNVTTNS